MQETNINMLQTVAAGLAELKDEMVFVGGAVAELYADDPAASDIRPTIDVDCVIELRSKREHIDLENKLRTKKFEHDTSLGAPICRWIYKDIKVDIMPIDFNILGFSNKWYSEGIENKIDKKLPNGTDISIFSLEYYLASKFEAHNNRGGSDLRQSHDFEDIIYILDNCQELEDHITNTNETVKSYLKDKCYNLLKKKDLIEGIEVALPYGSDSDSTEKIEGIIQSIAAL